MFDKPQGILHIQHYALRGGTEKFARELAHSMSNQRHYMLTTQTSEWLVEDLGQNSHNRYYFTADKAGTLLASLCTWLAIDIIHIHHLIGDRERLLNTIQDCGIAYGLTLHDYYLACPTINLINAKTQYCYNQTDVIICQQCLNQQKNLAHIDIIQWRQQHHSLLANACFISTPSESTTHIYQAWYPQPSFTTIAHGATPVTNHSTGIRTFLLPDDTVPHIGILGAMSQAKGEQRLWRLIERSQQRGLQLRWILIGYTREHQKGWQSQDYSLTIHGTYETKQIKPLLDHYRIPWIFFPSIAPETFCYTLTDAWQAGRPVLVPPIGALQERVKHYGGGWILENWLDDDSVLDQLVAIGDSRFKTELIQQTDLACQHVPISIQQATDAIFQLYQSVRSSRPKPSHILSKAVIMTASRKATMPQNGQRIWKAYYPIFNRYRKITRLLNSTAGKQFRRYIPVVIQQWLKRILFDI